MKALFETPRPLRNNLWFALGLVLSIAALFLCLIPPGWMPGCGFAYQTGLPCPSCGITRSLQLVLQGNLADAFAMQPLFFIFSAAFAGWFFFMLIAAAFKWPSVQVQLENRSEKLAILLLTALLIAGNWIYLILTNA